MTQRHNYLVIAGVALIAAGAAAGSRAAPCGCGHHSCTTAADRHCERVCKSSWDEKRSKTPTYTLECDFLCERARESWHADPAKCRCAPPAGTVFVKKKVFKTVTEEVEKVPKYEVQMVAAPACHGCQHRDCCCPRWYDLGSALSRLFGF